ncbi:NAD(P)/FAD-dependent oxidoreductase [Tatumella sp. UBA2305]|uniref:NAD(P)/FAD-dependent oxidoreductase n=1 Tax=Tatumella sp. UBA2305 TaxID=1947647 RepID=UPI0026009570|nr:FAD-binding oxidoreductase [Tatumella sp. UBA2305]
MTKRVAVIGAGVLGLSVARELALRGIQVTVFDRETAGAGTSTTSYAWINSNGKSPDSYHRLNAEAIDEHRKLQHNSPTAGRWLEESGTYEWAIDPQGEQQLLERVSRLTAHHYPLQQVTPGEIQTRIPELQIPPGAGSLWYFPQECLLNPFIYLAAQLAVLREQGAEMLTRCEVVDISEDSSGVTLLLSDGRKWQGDEVIIATGRWSQQLVNRLGLSLAMIDASQQGKVACGFLAYTTPVLTQLSANLISPELNIRPAGGGRLILQATDLDVHANPVQPPAVDGFIGREMLIRLRRLLANTDNARLESIAVGQRAKPADGLPAIGYLTPQRKVYLMVTHSGITLAPLIGRLVAEEVSSQQRPALLEDFAPDRLLGKTAADFPSEGVWFPAAQ